MKGQRSRDGEAELPEQPRENAGLSESFEWTAELSKQAASPGIFYLRKTICKEMPSRVAGQY